MVKPINAAIVTLVWLLLSFCGAVRAADIADTAPLSRAAILARLSGPDDTPLVQYRALRHLTASTRGGRMAASLDAWTSLDKDGRFTFEVVSESGSPLIRRRVLHAALEAEQQSQTAAAREQAALSAANYEFLEMRHDAAHLVKIDIRPRRKHVMLVDGSLFIEEETADLVRIEGELPKRPSIWTRRVRVVREYTRIDGVHVPVAMSSTADVLIVGTSNFSMTYEYAEINGRTVVR
jgi:hypothetical protein